MGLLNHPFWLKLLSPFFNIIFQLFNYFLWLRITEEGSIPEMSKWSISLIKSDLNWCIHLSKVSIYISNDTNVNDLVALILMLKTITLTKSERALSGLLTMAVTFVADDPDPKMSSRYLISMYRILNMYVEKHSRYIVSSWPWLLTLKFIDIFLSWSCIYT